jgi:hypothetical protein
MATFTSVQCRVRPHQRTAPNSGPFVHGILRAVSLPELASLGWHTGQAEPSCPGGLAHEGAFAFIAREQIEMG